MTSVRSAGTAPERAVRAACRELGLRFESNLAGLPGTPDLVIPRARVAIMIHGCFWHQHRCRRGKRKPASNRGYWLSKLRRNVARDVRVVRSLRRMGWRVLVVWECQTQDTEKLAERLRRFLARSDLGLAARRCR